MLQSNRKTVKSANVINIQRFSLQDGPGTRSTVFFKGCPLKCMWCSNPESQRTEPQLQFNKVLCDHCMKCVKVCPENAIRSGDKDLIFDFEKKIDWSPCIDACNRLALTMSGKSMTVDELVSELLKDQVFYGEDGGVTFSGGEALLHKDFLIQAARKLKKEGVHLILDTSGYAAEDVVGEVVPYFDEVFFDIKHMDNEKHLYYTGVNNQRILSNLYMISEMKVPVAIRYPMIPGINDSLDNLKAMADFISTLPQYTYLYVLPYHRYGVSKYESVGMTYKLPDLKAPDKNRVDKVKHYFASSGIRVAGLFNKQY